MQRLTAHTDPSGLFGTLGTAAAAVLTFLVAFGVPLTPDQTEATLGLVAVAGPVWTAWAIRRHAFAPKSVDEVASDAFRDGARAGAASGPEQRSGGV